MDPGAVGGGAGPQLTCGIVNDAGGKPAQNVIYATSDPGYNKVTLQIALNVGSALLSPGGIPDPASPPGPAAGTTIYIDLTDLQLAADTWRQLAFSSPGWSFRAFADEGVLGMTPKAAIHLVAGDAGAVKVAIGGVTIPGPLTKPRQATVSAQYYNVPAVPGQYSFFAVAVQNVPGQQADLADALDVSLSANGIVNTVPGPPAARNKFALQFAGRGVDVTAGPSTTLTVGFVYGSDEYGYGALASVSQALEFQVDTGGGADGWTITADRNALSPNWTLQPPEGHLIGGARSVVSISFANVVTTYQPGPTAMVISCSGVPGYRDGSFTQVLDKVPHAVVRSLGVTPNPARFHDGTAQVTVRWQAAAEGLELRQNYQSSDVTGKTEATAALDAGHTTFTLTATGPTGTVENRDQKTVRAVALPVIKSFTGVPAEIYCSEQSREVQLAWSVDSPDEVTLSSTAGGFDGQSFLPTGHVPVTVTETQLVTLAPKAAADQRTLTRKLVISAFSPIRFPAFLNFTPASHAVWPGGSFLVTGSESGLTFYDTIEYFKAASLPVGHAVQALGFSADGGTLAAAGPDGTVSMLTVSRSGIRLAGAASIGRPPRCLVVSPAGTLAYITVDPGDGRPGQVAVVMPAEKGGYRAGPAITVGVAPRGLTFDASGSRLFVANSGDDTVSIVALDQAGLPDGVSTIVGVKGAPEGVAATPNGRQLLVACPQAGTVVVIDPARPDAGPRAILQAGGAARQVATMAGGAYAAAAKDDGSVALIDCGGAPDTARVVDPTVNTGGDLLHGGISVTPDGLQLLVTAIYGLQVVRMTTHQTSEVAPPIPGNPTSVAISPDGGSVFGWHDARIPTGGPHPGLHVYQARLGTVTSLLPESEVTDLAMSPDPNMRQALAIIPGDPVLRLIATDTLNVSTCPLELAPGTLPVALAMQGDGQAAFAITRDPSHNLGLLVLRPSGATWRAGSALPLYQAATNGRLFLCSTPDGDTLFLADADAGAARVRVLRRAGQSYALSAAKITTGARPVDLTVAPDGSTAYVLTAGAPSGVTVIDVATLEARAVTVPWPYALAGLRPAVDGRWLYATDPDLRCLRALDPRTMEILRSFDLDWHNRIVAEPAGLAVFPDGSGIVTVNTYSQDLSLVEQVQLGGRPKRPQSRPGMTRPREG